MNGLQTWDRAPGEGRVAYAARQWWWRRRAAHEVLVSATALSLCVGRQDIAAALVALGRTQERLAALEAMLRARETS